MTIERLVIDFMAVFRRRGVGNTMTASRRNNCDRIAQQETDPELEKIGTAAKNTVREQNGSLPSNR
jgi:hypothetical protein